MQFPKYWVKGSYTGMTRKGTTMTIEAFGWSANSRDEALRMGVARAQRAVEAGFGGGPRSEYEYSEAPFREEILESIKLEGREVGIISRNRYGAMILNSAEVMFVDVDFPPIKSNGVLDMILTAFSSKRKKEKQLNIELETRRKIDAWRTDNPGRTFRLYRTFAGYRLLFLDRLYDPKEPATLRLLEELESDVLYRSLTTRQGCFRARLTPKPWRCRLDRPPSLYPWNNEAQELKYRKWEENYSHTIKQFTACHFENASGSSSADPQIELILKTHDALSVDGAKPLA